LYLPRSTAFLVGLLAIVKAGGVYVPVDVQAPQAYRALLLADAQPHVVVSSTSLADRLSGWSVLCVEEDYSTWPASNPVCVWHPDQLVHLAYTSGSTGTPKGVLVPHRQMLNWLHALWRTLPFGENEVVAQKTMASFSASMKELLGGLLAGVRRR